MKGEFLGLIGYFASPEALPEAVERAREAHLTDLEVYTPVPDAETVDAASPGKSLIPWLALGGGVTGMALGLWLTIWASRDYPLVTGGKPIVSLPPFLVIAFEVMALLAVFGALAGFLLLARLPNLRPSSAYRQELAVDRFALLIRCPLYGAPLRAERVLREAGAVEIRTVHEEETGLLGEPCE